MKHNKIIIAGLCLATLGMVPAARAAEAKAGDQNITLIQARTSADGQSEVRKELLEECIVALPDPKGLEAEVTASSLYLKGINGNAAQDGWTQTYTAALEINYMLRQKELIIVTTRSVQGQEPVMKVVDRNIRQTMQFVSNPADGDIFAGHSSRQHHFSTAEAAAQDAIKRAAIWVKQQSAVVCRDK